MKNKLLARIAASAISVAMLGSAVFAAEADPAINKTDTAATLTFLVGDANADISKDATQDQITMMAYLVGESATADAIPAYADEATTPMIALDQVGGAAGFGEIPVDVNKLASGKKIAVKLGCSAGTVKQFLIQLSASEPETIEIVLGDVTGDGKVNALDGAQLKIYLKSTASPKVNEKYPNIGNSMGGTLKDGTATYSLLGDINGDGKVNALDGAQLKIYLKSTSTPKVNEKYPNIGKTLTLVKD